MYIDKQGIKHNNIFLLMEETDGYLPGWYFSDETERFGNDDPFETLEDAERALNTYVKNNFSFPTDV